MEYIGVVAAILTTVSFLPQAIKVISTKDTSGISLIMYSLFLVGVFLWFIYGLYIKDMSVIGANAITFCFAAIVWFCKVKYK
ncbi:MAG: SemiSWEET transporter [Erysipelotrichaceae bacterium]